MNFRELIKKYKNGTASEEEIKLIKEEIDKNKIINELLMEEIDFESFKTSHEVNDEIYIDKSINEKAFLVNEESNKNTSINGLIKKINRSTRKIIIKSVSLTLLIILGVKFLIIPFLNKMYYNPNGKYKNEAGQTQLFIDMNVFSELNFPNYDLYFATATNEGIGEYDINLYYENLYDNLGEEINMKLERDSHIFTKKEGHLFHFNDYRFSNEIDLEGLPSSTTISAGLTLNEGKSIEEVYKIIKNYEVEVNYLQVKTHENNMHNYLGFNPNKSKYGYYIPEDGDFPVDLNIYPSFYLTEENSRDYKDKEEHFKSILKYITTREEFMDVFFNYNYYNIDNYKEYLKYVEENGVIITGFTAFGNIDEMKELFEDEKINDINIYEARFSKYQK